MSKGLTTEQAFERVLNSDLSVYDIKTKQRIYEFRSYPKRGNTTIDTKENFLLKLGYRKIQETLWEV